MNIKNTLKQIGIDGKKADVYLSCLELGKATAYLVSKKCGLKRPTVYDIINQLMKEGLIYKSVKNNTRYYSPADPEILTRKLKEKEENVQKIMPFLQNLYASPKTKPFIRYFEGSEGIKAMYDDSLNSLKKGDELLAYVGSGVLNNIPDYIFDYVKRRVKIGVRTRGIYREDKYINDYMKKNRIQLREARILDEKIFPIKNEINIYANKVSIASYGTEMIGMIIESKEIAADQRAIFELAWRGAERL